MRINLTSSLIVIGIITFGQVQSIQHEKRSPAPADGGLDMSTAKKGVDAFQESIKTIMKYVQIDESRWNDFYLVPMEATDLGENDISKRNLAISQLADSIPWDTDDPINPTRTGSFSSFWNVFLNKVAFPSDNSAAASKAFADAVTKMNDIVKRVSFLSLFPISFF